jgi:hypothetical protein
MYRGLGNQSSPGYNDFTDPLGALGIVRTNCYFSKILPSKGLTPTWIHESSIDTMSEKLYVCRGLYPKSILCELCSAA